MYKLLRNGVHGFWTDKSMFMSSSGIKRLPNWFALQRNCPSTINYCFLETFLDFFGSFGNSTELGHLWPYHILSPLCFLRFVKFTHHPQKNTLETYLKNQSASLPSSFEDDDFPFPKDMHPRRSLEGRYAPLCKVWGLRTTDQAGKAHTQWWRALERFKQRVTAPWADDGLARGQGVFGWVGDLGDWGRLTEKKWMFTFYLKTLGNRSRNGRCSLQG